MADHFYLTELQQLRHDVIAAMRTTFSGGKRATAEFSIRNRSHRMESLEGCRKLLQWINEEIGRLESVSKMVPTRHRARLTK
ncbi:hypothetical protein Enr13x_07190 [Stieleria neptunia]|uniref:Uncharacterized protein n=1 Tax=Stieleria neptunia TaxID=2527979 RepID=A0A518HJ90_9BACT|nr:hypothetical protein [Stieleria neptunia]QDV40883.1 hypothetical protein Enr13x_07190 [Stieleria neptunia]